MVDLVPNAPSVRFEVVPGGHLGMLTGRAARGTTWRIVDEFIDEHATPTPVAPDRKTSAKKPAKKSPAKKTAARTSGGDSTPARKRTAKKSAPRPDAIGSNPARRYGSASSRSLAAGS